MEWRQLLGELGADVESEVTCRQVGTWVDKGWSMGFDRE